MVLRSKALRVSERCSVMWPASWTCLPTPRYNISSSSRGHQGDEGRSTCSADICSILAITLNLSTKPFNAILPVIHPYTHTFNPDTPFPLSLSHAHTHRYLDRLASSLLQHLKLSQRATSQAWDYTSRKAEAAATAASLEPKLTLFITETKSLQTKVSVAMVTTGNTELVAPFR